MYGKVNAVLRSKAAMWSITLFAIVLFCITATLAFGMGTHKTTDKHASDPAEKIPSIQPKASGLQVQNSSGDASPTQLQGQIGNGSVSQPAAPASVAPNAGLDGGIAATQVQNTNAAGSATTSASLQPNAGGAGVQAQANALGLDLNAQLNLP